MYRHIPASLLVLLTSGFISLASAQSSEVSAEQNPGSTLHTERTDLIDILDAVQRNSEKSFLINRLVPKTLSVGNIHVPDLSYPILLQILRNNDLAAVTVDGMINVIPVGIVRQYALPELPERRNSLSDEEWVTGVITVENAEAPTFIPIMRPMMPRAGHLAANPGSNSIVIVDRLGNARRILALIRKLDQATLPPQSE